MSPRKLTLLATAVALLCAMGWLLASMLEPDRPAGPGPETGHGATEPAPPVDATPAMSTGQGQVESVGRNEDLGRTETGTDGPASATAGAEIHITVTTAVRTQGGLGTPTVGRKVTLHSVSEPEGTRRSAITDAAGKVVFRQVPPGSWKVASGRASLSLTVRAGSRYSNNLLLLAERAVSILVSDLMDRPVPDAEVYLAGGGSGDPFVVIPTVAEILGRTDRNGRLALQADFSLTPLGARAAGHGPLHTLQIKEDESSAEVRIQLGQPNCRVHVQVLDPHRAPVAGADVQLALGSTLKTIRADKWLHHTLHRRHQATTDVHGECTFFDLSEATGQLLVHRDGLSPRTQEVNVVPGVQRIEIQLRKGVRVHGRVLDPAGDPVVGATFGARMAHTDHDGKPKPTFTHWTSDLEGRFDISGLLSGQLELWVSGGPTRPRIERVTVDGDVIEWNPILGPPQRIHGRLVDGAGNGRERVTLTARGEMDSQRALTSSDGSFSFPLVAGEYDIFTTAGTGILPDVLLARSVIAGTTGLILQLPAHSTVSTDDHSPSDAALMVQLKEHGSIDKAAVEAFTLAGQRVLATTLPVDGSEHTFQVPEGPLRVVVSGYGVVPQLHEHTTTAEQPTRLALELQSGRPLRILMRTVAGAPLRDEVHWKVLGTKQCSGRLVAGRPYLGISLPIGRHTIELSTASHRSETTFDVFEGDGEQDLMVTMLPR